MPIQLQPAWPPALTLDIALETHDLPELLEKYDLTQTDLERLYDNQNFRRELIATRTELALNGSSFRAKARVMAEAHLDTMNAIMSDPEVPAQTKVTVWQAFVKYASLEPVKELPTQTQAPKLTIEIKQYTNAQTGQSAVATSIDLSIPQNLLPSQPENLQDWFDA